LLIDSLLTPIVESTYLCERRISILIEIEAQNEVSFEYVTFCCRDKELKSIRHLFICLSGRCGAYAAPAAGFELYTAIFTQVITYLRATTSLTEKGAPRM